MKLPVLGLSKKILILPILAIIFVSLGSALYFGWKYRQSSSLVSSLQNPEQAAQAEVKQVVKEVGRVMVLPSGTPTVATVTDTEKLQDQAFFAMAQNKDKVLIYTEAKKAILYRPSTKQIVEISPLTIQEDSSENKNTSSESTPQATTTALYNGTTTSGLTTRYEKLLQTELPELKTNLKQNAARADYVESVIVDVTGQNTQLVEKIAQKFSINIGSLPENESKPDASILIILGTDAIDL